MQQLFEIEILCPNGSRRAIRVRALNEESAWERVSLAADELASIRTIIEMPTQSEESVAVKQDDATIRTQSVSKTEESSASHGDSRNHNSFHRPPIMFIEAGFEAFSFLTKPAAMLSEVLLKPFTPWAAPEAALSNPKIRPSLIVPASIIARRALCVFYWTVFLASALINSREISYVPVRQYLPTLTREPMKVRRVVGDLEINGWSVVWGAVALLSWMAIIAMVRYAAVIYPWEKRRTAALNDNARGARSGGQ